MRWGADLSDMSLLRFLWSPRALLVVLLLLVAVPPVALRNDAPDSTSASTMSWLQHVGEVQRAEARFAQHGPTSYVAEVTLSCFCSLYGAGRHFVVAVKHGKVAAVASLGDREYDEDFEVVLKTFDDVPRGGRSGRVGRWVPLANAFASMRAPFEPGERIGTVRFDRRTGAPIRFGTWNSEFSDSAWSVSFRYCRHTFHACVERALDA